MKKLLLLLLVVYPLHGFADAIVRGQETTICVNVPVSAAAYAANDIVYTTDANGLITITGAFRPSVYSGVITSVRVTDAAAQAVGYNFIPIKTALTGGTIVGNGPVTIADADLTKVGPTIGISAQTAFADNIISYWTGAQSMVSTDTSLRALLTTTGAPTYAAVTDVNLCVTIMQD